MVKIDKRRFGVATVGVPANWVDNSVINFIGPDVDGVRPNLVVIQRQVTGKPSAAQFAKQQKAMLEEAALTEFQILEEGAVVVGKRKFHRLAFSWLFDAASDEGAAAGAKPVHLRQDQYYLVDGQKTLTVTLTCPLTGFAKMQPVFAAIVDETALD
ncbi:MAG: DcrB-related protein [Deltaproteobacteria bacterium]|nr:DcrB-related protein [Deltaproteobacteria bacterium]